MTIFLQEKQDGLIVSINEAATHLTLSQVNEAANLDIQPNNICYYKNWTIITYQQVVI